MCCGRAVYVYDQFGGDGWITPDNYAAFEADHFAGQATDTPVTLERLTADLADYSPDMGVVNHELVRTHHAARRHAIDLVEVLRGPHAGPADRVETLAELARLARATMRAELHAAEQDARAASAERELEAWRARATEAERQADAARRLLVTKRVRAGLALGKAADRVRGRP